MSTRDLTCSEAIAFLLDYLEETLPADERASFEAHLAECDACVRYLALYERTIRLTKDAAEADEPEIPMPEELVEAIVAARKRQS